mmetsp:Transcript_2261/g.3548  ORF Transcript_2261/g.3548 Transcript_2261/m.3548 type:complete len:127 (-) Transcript_2261:200-580(-)
MQIFHEHGSGNISSNSGMLLESLVKKSNSTDALLVSSAPNNVKLRAVEQFVFLLSFPSHSRRTKIMAYISWYWGSFQPECTPYGPPVLWGTIFSLVLLLLECRLSSICLRRSSYLGSASKLVSMRY